MWEKYLISLRTLILPIALASPFAAINSAYGEALTLPAAMPSQDAPQSRNENSTPRISVLPVSPALASEDSHSEDYIPPGTVLRLKAILMRLGYDAGLPDSRITAKFKAAVYMYQKAHQLPPTGSLDPTTIQAIKGQ